MVLVVLVEGVSSVSSVSSAVSKGTCPSHSLHGHKRLTHYSCAMQASTQISDEHWKYWQFAEVVLFYWNPATAHSEVHVLGSHSSMSPDDQSSLLYESDLQLYITTDLCTD